MNRGKGKLVAALEARHFELEAKGQSGNITPKERRELLALDRLIDIRNGVEKRPYGRTPTAKEWDAALRAVVETPRGHLLSRILTCLRENNNEIKGTRISNPAHVGAISQALRDAGLKMSIRQARKSYPASFQDSTYRLAVYD